MTARIDDARKLAVILLTFLVGIFLDGLYALGFLKD
jgi:hypothetical protein